MGVVSHSSAKRPSSPVKLNLSPFPRPGSAFRPPSLYSCCACHPPTCSVSSLSPLPTLPLPHLQQRGASRLPRLESSLLGLDEDEKQRPVLTEAQSCGKGGSRAPEHLVDNKGSGDPEPRANGGGEASLHRYSGLGSCAAGESHGLHQAWGGGCGLFTTRSPQCLELVLFNEYLRDKYSPELWKGQGEKED